jgi:four helix bundle protein
MAERSGAVQRFEDLMAWQKARVLTRDIYLATKDKAFARDFGLCGQVQRAAVSIMSNIAEGYERSSRADYRRFVVVAKASCAELRSQLYVAHDIGYLDHATFSDSHQRTDELARILEGLERALGQPS